MGLATDILDTVSEILVDHGRVSYTLEQGYRHLFDAELAVMAVRSDESVREIDVQLKPGVHQELPAGAWRIRSILRNRGRTGNLADGPTVRLVAKGPMDGLAASLSTGFDQNANTALVVREVMYDERDPKLFDVQPAMADDNTWLRLKVEMAPVGYEFPPGTPGPLLSIYDPDAQTVVSDRYSNALVEWVLYRFLTRKTDLTAANSEADAHYQRFFAQLGVSLNSDAENSVKNRRQQS